MSVEFLRATPLFHDLSDTELREIVSILREESRPGGTTLFRSDGTCSELYLIRKGYVRLFDSNGSVLATLGPGSLLGEAEFLRGLAHNTSAVAASDIEMWALPDSELRKVLQRRYGIGIKLSQNFGEQISQLEDYLVEKLGKTSVLDGVPIRVIAPMARSMRPHRLQRGKFLYQSGEEPEALFLLERGVIEMQPSPSPEDPSPTAKIIEPGHLFGVLPLLTDKRYEASAYAVEDCVVWALAAATFHSLSSQYPLLRRSLGRHSRGRLSASDQAKAAERLGKTPIFGRLEPAELNQVAQSLVLQHVPSGESIYRLGDGSEAFFLVDEGEVELTAENESGVLEELARIGVGSFFGAMSMLKGDDRLENATALRNTNLWVMNRSDLDELAGRFAALRSAIDETAATSPTPQRASVDEGRLRQFALLAGLDLNDLNDVARHMRLAQFKQGEQVFRAGAPSDALFFIEKGVVRLQLMNGAGSWTRGPGEVFGEKAILSDEPYGQSAYAETDLELFALETPGLALLKSRLPTVASDLHRILSQPVGDAGAPAVPPPPRSTGAPTVEAPANPAQRRQDAARAGQIPPTESGPIDEGWFDRLGVWGKVRLVLVVVLLVYLGIVALPVLLGLAS